MPDTDPRKLLLDTPPEAAFDRITQLATQFLRVPVSLVSIVDTHRQFFKSQCGLGEPLSSLRETPLSHSFCQHVAASAAPLIVADAREHPLVRDNLAIPDLGVIAYLGVPLFDDRIGAYGALCAIDGQPRRWTERDIEIMQALAAQVMGEIVLRIALDQQSNDLETLRLAEQNRSYATRADRHDLRTPLNALLMAVQAMKQVGDLNEEHLEYLHMAERNGHALVAMIDKMLDITAIESRGGSALSKGITSPLELVVRAVEQVTPLVREKRQTLKSSTDTVLSIPVDAEKIVRVLVNLLGNAIKFTPEGGQITIHVGDYVGDDGPAVLFSVQDTGIGISDDDRERIFAEGFRVDRSAPTRRSTGLGLTFCKRIIEAHNGKIWVDSKPQEGSTFRFLLSSSG